MKTAAAKRTRVLWPWESKHVSFCLQKLSPVQCSGKALPLVSSSCAGLVSGVWFLVEWRRISSLDQLSPSGVLARLGPIGASFGLAAPLPVPLCVRAARGNVCPWKYRPHALREAKNRRFAAADVLLDSASGVLQRDADQCIFSSLCTFSTPAQQMCLVNGALKAAFRCPAILA